MGIGRIDKFERKIRKGPVGEFMIMHCFVSYS